LNCHFDFLSLIFDFATPFDRLRARNDAPFLSLRGLSPAKRGNQPKQSHSPQLSAPAILLTAFCLLNCHFDFLSLIFDFAPPGWGAKDNKKPLC